MLETTFNKFSDIDRVSNILLTKESKSFQDITSLITSHNAFTNFESIIGHEIRDTKLFVNALTHPSFHNENSDAFTDHYERLEFLGDSFISLAMSSILIEELPNSSEGELSKMRASLVNKDALSKLAKAVNLDQLLLVGKGEVKNNGMKKDSILSDILESVFGAIYLEAGFNDAYLAFKKLIEYYTLKSSFSFIDLSRLKDFDYKSKLQEDTMKELGQIPEYRECIKNKNDGLFEIELFLGTTSYGRITSKSKKIAKDSLAKKIFIEKKYKK